MLGDRYQTERIVACSRIANNLLRLEVHWDGVGTSLFAASSVERQFHGSTVHARDRR